MNLLKMSLGLLAICLLLCSCSKENIDESIVEKEEVEPTVSEVLPGQATISLKGGSLLEEMRFDSAYFFTRDENEVTNWFFNAEFSDTPGEAFFLDFSSPTMAPGTYSVRRFEIAEFEDVAPDQSFAGTYEGDLLDMDITILSISDGGVTGSMRGSIDTQNGRRELSGEFVEVPIN